MLRVLRIEGLIPFTVSAILLGFVVTLWETGLSGANWMLFALAAATAVLLHMDGHVWNDIMDLEVDRREKSSETGRDRPLVLGWATVGVYRRISATMMAVVIALSAYMTIYRAWIPLLILLGLFFDYGYNHPRVALAYGPFTEWYIFPWLVVGVTVTTVYAATGVLSLLAFELALLQGMTVTCFVVSMMRRDMRSDMLGGKHTSSVLYPAWPHATTYGVVTMAVAVLMVWPLAGIIGPAAYAICAATALVAGINMLLGIRVDRLCTRAVHEAFPEFEARAHRLTMRQVQASLVHVAALSAVLLVLGVPT
jgi:4-hydroxybenzoate polyprenyltransferase